MYITPDQVYKDAPDAIPFIYTKEHHLEIGRPGDVHMASTENINFNKKYPNITKGEQLGELGLLGRIANDYDDWRVNDQFYPSLVTFWNHDKSIYGLLNACLKALMNKNLIHESTFVSTPFHRIPTMVKDLNKSIIQNLTNQDKERIDQLRKIHLMGAEKGQVLKKLGIQSKIGPRRPVIGDHFNLNFKKYLNEVSMKHLLSLEKHMAKNPLPTNNLFGNKSRIVIPYVSNTLEKYKNKIESIVDPNTGKQRYFVDLKNQKIYEQVATQQGMKQREIRVGKLLNLLGIDSNEGNYSIVVSRNPIDVLRMSDFSHIQSCLSPDSEQWHCTKTDSKNGGVVAFLVKQSDLSTIHDFQGEEIFHDSDRNIQGISPIARIRFLQISSPSGLALVPEKKAYGNKDKNFINSVKDWSKRQAKPASPAVHIGGEYSDTEPKKLVNNIFKIRHKSIMHESEVAFNDLMEKYNFQHLSVEFHKDPTGSYISSHMQLPHVSKNFISYVDSSRHPVTIGRLTSWEANRKMVYNKLSKMLENLGFNKYQMGATLTHISFQLDGQLNLVKINKFLKFLKTVDSSYEQIKKFYVKF